MVLLLLLVMLVRLVLIHLRNATRGDDSVTTVETTTVETTTMEVAADLVAAAREVQEAADSAWGIRA